MICCLSGKPHSKMYDAWVTDIRNHSMIIYEWDKNRIIVYTISKRCKRSYSNMIIPCYKHWSIYDNVYACKKYEIWNESYLSLSCYRIFFSKEHSKYDCEAYFKLRFKDNKDIKNSIYNISKERKCCLRYH